MRKKIKSLVYGIVYVLIISGIIGYFGYLVDLSTNTTTIYRSQRIYIRSNNDFIKYGFPGSGTQTDPYIIENYTILTPGRYDISAISIGGVSK